MRLLLLLALFGWTTALQQQLYPRAAVAVALRCGGENTKDPRYLLIQRANEPNRGKWSLPGGKLEWGESMLEGAKRELKEETLLEEPLVVWAKEPVGVLDSIHDDFHYVIAVCFARTTTTTVVAKDPPEVVGADDAMDAQWWSLNELEDRIEELASPRLIQRLQSIEWRQQTGTLLVEP